MTAAPDVVTVTAEAYDLVSAYRSAVEDVVIDACLQSKRERWRGALLDDADQDREQLRTAMAAAEAALLTRLSGDEGDGRTSC